MKASAHMVRLDAPDPAALRGGRSDRLQSNRARDNSGARPTGRTGAHTSSQPAARNSNGASVQSAVSSSAAGLAFGDPKSTEESQKTPSFDAIFEEFEAGAKQDSKGDAKQQKDPDTSQTQTAAVQVTAAVKEILPIVLALPARIQAAMETKPGMVNPAISNPAGANPLAIAPVADSQSAMNEATPASEPEQMPTAKIDPPAAPPIPESTPIIPRGDIAFTAKLIQNPEETSKAAVGPANAHAPQAPIQAIQKNASIASIIETAVVQKIAEPILRAIPMAAEIANASHSMSAPKIETSLPLNAAAAISKLADVIDLPPAPPNSSNEIVVRIPDATERGTDVRFVERAGEINVTVRTSDSEMAQSLRSGLTDLSARLEQNGIRAEMWKPGSDNSQEESSRKWSDQKNAQAQRQAQESEDNQKNSKRPKWVEALELSLGRQN